MRKWEAMLFSMIFIGCKKPYNPPVIASPGSYLVVDGVINSGPDSTTISLSRTVSLSSNVNINPELHAIVIVQSDQNVSYPLTETTNGKYVSAGLNLDNTHNYRLSIKTTNNEQYQSDFVPVLNSPPIDSVTYTTTGNQLNIYSNTHDPKNSIKYYRWSYQETWLFHSFYNSQYVSNGDTVLLRTASQQVYQCWGNDTASNIIIGSAAKLTKDVIVNNPITSVASSSEKLSSEYSILVKQYALTADAYNFYLNLKKNTEQLGSIFDAQSSQINGNIHCVTNPAKPVIGYISAGNTSEQRIFISNRQLPEWATVYPYTINNCPLDTELFVYHIPNSSILIFQEDQDYNYLIGGGPYLIPVGSVGKTGANPIGHSGSYPLCVDCTLRGTNIKPAFWK